jgi:hypothetical protein
VELSSVEILPALPDLRENPGYGQALSRQMEVKRFGDVPCAEQWNLAASLKFHLRAEQQCQACETDVMVPAFPDPHLILGHAKLAAGLLWNSGIASISMPSGNRSWFDRSAMADLLDDDFRLAAKDTLYRCHDHLLNHREALFTHLKDRWAGLFGASYDTACTSPLSNTTRRRPPAYATATADRPA